MQLLFGSLMSIALIHFFVGQAHKIKSKKISKQMSEEIVFLASTAP
jgi:hypothetical protein